MTDAVMDGISQATFTKLAGLGVFAGTIESSGGFNGFVTTRLKVPTRGLPSGQIRVGWPGDSKRYYLLIRHNKDWDGVMYRHPIQTIKDK